MRFTICVAMLAVWLIALQCTVSSAEGESHEESSRLLTGSGSPSSDAPSASSGSADAAPADAAPADAAPVDDSHATGSSITNPSNSVGTVGVGATAGSSSASVSRTAGNDNDAHTDPAGSGNSLTKENDKGTNGNQEKNKEKQKPANETDLQKISTVQLDSQQEQKEKLTTGGNGNKTPGENIKTSEDVKRQNEKQNTKNPTIDVERNSGTSLDSKPVNMVSTDKVSPDAPKENPLLPTGTEDKMNLTTTTKLVDDVESTKYVNESSTAPTKPLTKLSKAALQLQSLDNKDNSRSSSLVLAFATLFTAAVIALAAVY